MESAIYLFTGPEIGERTETVLNIKKEISKKYGEIDFYNLYADSTPISQVLSILETGNLFMSAVCVVLHNAHEIKKKEEIEAITKWAKREQTFPAFLILTSDEISISKTIENIIPKNKKQIFWELFENKKHEWITSFFSKQNMKIKNEAIESILELVENNTDALKASCSHLSLFFDEGKVIEREDIESLLSHTKEETAFSLFTAITHLNLQQSLTITQKLMQVKNTSPIQIIAGLIFCFRRLLDWHNAIIEAKGFDEFNMKKNGFTSKTAIAQYKRAEKSFSLNETKHILALLTQNDYEMRSIGATLQNVLLDKLIYCIIIKHGNEITKYKAIPYKIF